MQYIDSIYIVLAIVFSAFILYQESFYRVNANDQVVINLFGELTAKTSPGRYFKIPFIQKAHYYPKSTHRSKNDHQISTPDKKIIRLNIQVSWKLDDPIKFYNRLRYFDENAEDFIQARIRSAESAILTDRNVGNIVLNSIDSATENMECHPQVIQEIRKEAQSGLKEYGILLLNVDVKITYLH